MRTRGFTLAELAIVVAVVGIGGSLAAVGMSDQIARSRARSEALQVSAKLRSEYLNSRERRRGIRIVSETLGAGGQKISFLERGEDCESTTEISPPLELRHTSLTMPGGEHVNLCFDERGQEQNKVAAVRLTTRDPNTGGVEAVQRIVIDKTGFSPQARRAEGTEVLEPQPEGEEQEQTH